MFESPSPFEQPPIIELEKASVESQPREREFVGVVVETVAPGSASEDAGIKAGDIIDVIDGLPVQNRRDYLAIATNKEGNPMKFSVMRGEQMLELTLTPRLDDEAGRYRIGVDYVPVLFVRKLDEKGNARLLERKRGRYYDDKDRPICEYLIDMDHDSSPVFSGERRVLGRQIESIKFQSHGKTFDLMEQFNHTNTSVFVAPELASGGLHNGYLGRIIVASIEKPSYVGTLIHELTHADQQKDPAWRPYLDLYGLSGFTLDPEKVFKGGFSRGLELIGRAIPELVDSEDIEPALHILDPILEKGRRLQEEIRTIKEFSNQEIQRVHADQINRLRGVLDEFLSDKYENVFLDPLPKGLRDKLIEGYQRLGFETDFSRLQKITDFYWLVGTDSIGIPADLETNASYYNAESGLRSSIFRMKSYNNRIEFRLTAPQSLEDSKDLEQKLKDWSDEYAKAFAELKETFVQAEGVELRPGLTVFNALAYPRWVVERDAERGKLVGMRKIRQEIGADFFRKLSPLTESDRAIKALSKNEEFLKTQPSAIQANNKELVRQIEEMEKMGGSTPVELVRAYMGMIGATHKAMRMMKTEQNMHMKKSPKKLS